MKYLLVLFAGVFIFSACDNPEQFASVIEEEQQVSESSEYQRDLQSIVEAEVKKKISGKKRKNINIKQTVGKKNLGKKRNIIFTKIDVTNIIVDESGKQEIEKEEDSGEQVVSLEVQKTATVEEVSVPEEKLDILFYMNNRDSKCIKTFRWFYEENSFLSHLDGLNWQVSFSYYASGQRTAFLPLERYNGQPYDKNKKFFQFELDYVLSKGEYSSKRAKDLLFTTLESTYPNHDKRGGAQKRTPNSNGYVDDPLSGLDHILSTKAKGAVRSDSHVVVLLFDYDFPYYSSKEWKSFFEKHENVSVIAVAHRSANVSNMYHALERSYDFEYLPACYGEGLLDLIQSKAQ